MFLSQKKSPLKCSPLCLIFFSNNRESVTGGACQENANEDSDVEICEEENDANNPGGITKYHKDAILKI